MLIQFDFFMVLGAISGVLKITKKTLKIEVVSGYTTVYFSSRWK
jgi:hypothetical protein